ncbi:MAG TPA: SprT-like domain-containing protein, partial [Microterricola sp.]
MADLERVRHWANALIALHLNPAIWSFGFDNAKKRAGLCNFTAKRITVSRYLAARYDDDEIHQILLHEVAHALAGSRAGHGPRWAAIARDLGYEGERTHHGEIADELAPWLGL